MVVHWSASVLDPGTYLTHLLPGDSADRESAIADAVSAARSLTRRSDGAHLRVARIGIWVEGADDLSVHIDGWDDLDVDDAAMRHRVDAALVEEKRTVAERTAAHQRALEDAAGRGQTWHATLMTLVETPQACSSKFPT